MKERILILVIVINALANIAILSTIIYNKKSKKKDDVEK